MRAASGLTRRRLLGLVGGALNEYIKHVGSAIFAVPGGATTPGDWVGRALFT